MGPSIPRARKKVFNNDSEQEETTANKSLRRHELFASPRRQSSREIDLVDERERVPALQLRRPSSVNYDKHGSDSNCWYVPDVFCSRLTREVLGTLVVSTSYGTLYSINYSL
jgi:hypothetical protein